MAPKGHNAHTLKTRTTIQWQTEKKNRLGASVTALTSTSVDFKGSAGISLATRDTKERALSDKLYGNSTVFFHATTQGHKSTKALRRHNRCARINERRNSRLQSWGKLNFKGPECEM